MKFERRVVSGDGIVNGGGKGHVKAERRVIRERKMPVLSCLRWSARDGYALARVTERRHNPDKVRNETGYVKISLYPLHSEWADPRVYRKRRFIQSACDDHVALIPPSRVASSSEGGNSDPRADDP